MRLSTYDFKLFYYSDIDCMGFIPYLCTGSECRRKTFRKRFFIFAYPSSYNLIHHILIPYT